MKIFINLFLFLVAISYLITSTSCNECFGDREESYAEIQSFYFDEDGVRVDSFVYDSVFTIYPDDTKYAFQTRGGGMLYLPLASDSLVVALSSRGGRLDTLTFTYDHEVDYSKECSWRYHYQNFTPNTVEVDSLNLTFFVFSYDFD